MCNNEMLCTHTNTCSVICLKWLTVIAFNFWRNGLMCSNPPSSHNNQDHFSSIFLLCAHLSLSLFFWCVHLVLPLFLSLSPSFTNPLVPRVMRYKCFRTVIAFGSRPVCLFRTKARVQTYTKIHTHTHKRKKTCQIEKHCHVHAV